MYAKNRDPALCTGLIRELRNAVTRIHYLPEDIAYFREDVVYVKSDLLQTPRTILRQSFSQDGTVKYDLAHTDAERRAIREREAAAEQNSGRLQIASRLMLPALRVAQSDVHLVSRGNIYQLYHGEPDDLQFNSIEDEAEFWAGVAQTPKELEEAILNHGFRLAESIAMVERGEADAIGFQSMSYRLHTSPRSCR